MKLWLLKQDKNNGYDTYDSAVVIAETEEEAKKIELGSIDQYGSWVAPEFVTAKYIGEAIEGLQGDDSELPFSKNVICASFNSG